MVKEARKPTHIFGRAAALVALGLLALVASCGGDDDSSDTSTGSPSPAESTVTDSSPTPSLQPSPAVTVLTPSVEELVAVSEAMFPLSADDGSYTSCDFPYTAAPDTFAACPVTSRLNDRLLELDASGLNASPICRCQNFSEDRFIAVSPTQSGGTATITLFGQTLKLYLIMVREADGSLLVDDIYCAGELESSIYADGGASACQPAITAAP